MSANRRRGLISSILIDLANPHISEKRRNSLCNELSVSLVLRATTQPKEKSDPFASVPGTEEVLKHPRAQIINTIIEKEKAKIESRGYYLQYYLMGSEQSLESTLRYFYKNSYIYDGDKRVLSEKIVLSELILIFVVLAELMDIYTEASRTTCNEVLKKKAELRKNNTPNTRVELDLLREKLTRLASFREYVKTLCSSVNIELYASLGVKANERATTKVGDYVSLAHEYKETLKSFPLIRKKLNEIAGMKNLTAAYGISLLQNCGDKSDDLVGLYEDVKTAQKVKN